MKRICGSCKEEKNLSDFRKDKNHSSGYGFYCKLCARNYGSAYYAKYKSQVDERNRQRRKIAKEYIQNLKRETGCICCGEKDDCCLDLHHLDPHTKERTVSMMLSWTLEAIQKEIAKCVVICSNCHRKLHAGKIKL